MLFSISVWWILLAIAVYFMVGALWYSPVLFSKPWLAALGKKREELSMGAMPMVMTALAIAVLVVVEAWVVQATGTVGWRDGAMLGLMLWLGFAATTGLINSAFQGRSIKLYIIDQGYHLVGIVLAGAILAH
jgi:hypothetical protein